MTRDVALTGLAVWLAVVIASLWRFRTEQWDTRQFLLDVLFGLGLAVAAILTGAGVVMLRRTMGAL